MNNISSGEITNLIANDSRKIEFLMAFFNCLWVRYSDGVNRSPGDARLLSVAVVGTANSVWHCISLLAFRLLCCFDRCWLYDVSPDDPAVVWPCFRLPTVCHSLEPLSMLSRICSTKILQVTDERAKIMSEIIGAMRTVKIYCWESAFIKKLCLVRR